MKTPPTLGELILGHAEAYPERLAFTFQRRGAESYRITYGELADGASRIATILRLHHQQPIVLIFPSGIPLIQAIFGTWIAGAIAVPAMPPRAGRRADRLLSILGSSKPAAVVVDDSCAEIVQAVLDENNLAIPLHKISELLQADPDLTPDVRSADVALLQYTSGSIGDPKGVVLTHANIIANQRMIAKNFGHHAEGIMVGWLPMHHDMGLIGNVIQPIYLGTPCHLMAPETFLMRPLSWLELISSTRGTSSGGPNFAFDLCASRIPKESLEGLDLSSWVVAFNGAEPLRPQTLSRFMQHVKETGFQLTALHPCYGLAEASLIVTGKPPGTKPRILKVEGEETPRVSSGRVVEGTEVAIVDPDSKAQVVPGGIGEIWVRSSSVARGYWPDKGTETFGQLLGNEGGWLRTGDMGCLLDGELLVTGRLKDMLIIGGQNHFAEDIEHVVQLTLGRGSDNAVAAFAIDGVTSEGLVVIIENDIRESLDTSGASRKIDKSLTECFEIRAADIQYVPRGRLPRTTSGKIRRSETRSRYLAKEAPFDQR